MTERFDAVVVGAGPAGSAAALVLAQGGASVCLLERGPFPGSKNMYGGVIYGRILDGLIPQWWDEAPVQRWVTRRCTTMLTAGQALTIDYRTSAWGSPPYNGATAFRPDFDAWLAG
ncbi:MAG: FAD-dependent oxidoreductase, partial [Actinobacteria bacterium]|nr:FAD-dependent oxidoreductase [Actinomycetota bacterium]